MMRRSPSLLFAAVLFACGGSASSEMQVASPVDVSTPPPAPEALTDYLPPETTALVTVDVARLRSSPYYPTIRRFVESASDSDAQVSQGVHELMESTRVVHIAAGPKNGRMDVLGVVFEGSYAEGQVRRVLTSMASNQTLTEGTVAGFPATIGGDAVLVDLGNGRWFFGPQTGTSALSAPRAPEAMRSPGYVAAAARLTTPAPIARFVALGDPALARELARNSPLDATSAARVQGVALAVDATNGIQAEGYMVTDGADLAAQVAQFVRGQVNQAVGTMELRVIGVSAILERTQVVEDGPVVGASLSVTDAEVRDLIDRLGGLIGASGQ